MMAGPPSWSRQRPHDGSRGFQPTDGIIQMRLRRGATLETGGSDPGPPHQASRRDAITSRSLNRGLKPTATFAKSLRDKETVLMTMFWHGTGAKLATAAETATLQNSRDGCSPSRHAPLRRRRLCRRPFWHAVRRAYRAPSSRRPRTDAVGSGVHRQWSSNCLPIRVQARRRGLPPFCI